MLRIAAGRVYDPANGIAGDVRDVCVQDGRIVADVPGHARRIDARQSAVERQVQIAFLLVTGRP